MKTRTILLAIVICCVVISCEQDPDFVAGHYYYENQELTPSPTITTATVTTATVSNITATTATCGGSVITDGGAPVIARGVCWSTSQNPTTSSPHITNGTGTGNFTITITGLTANKTYYVRAYATNKAGTAYGEQKSFTTLSKDGQPCPGILTVTDYEGNVYNTVQIGNQCWMRENMRTKHYADGSAIPSGGSSVSNSVPHYYDYSGSGIFLSQRGYLYNWPAAMHGAASSNTNPSHVQGICPDGWHLPSDAEWTQLTNYVGSHSEYCGGNSNNIAKALASETGWNTSTANYAVGNNQGLNNATGFSAVPAGYCIGSSFSSVGYYAYFWSSTQNDSSGAWRRYLYCNGATVIGNSSGKRNGFSVRCLRD